MVQTKQKVYNPQIGNYPVKVRIENEGTPNAQQIQAVDVEVITGSITIDGIVPGIHDNQLGKLSATGTYTPGDSVGVMVLGVSSSDSTFLPFIMNATDSNGLLVSGSLGALATESTLGTMNAKLKDGQLVMAQSLAVTTATDQALGFPTATTGNITASAQTVSANCAGYGIVGISVSGTYTNLQMIFEVFDGNANNVWSAVNAIRVGGALLESTSGALSNTTRYWKISTGGATQIRVRSTAFGTGTANIVITPQAMTSDPTVMIANTVTVSGGVSITNASVTVAGTITVGNTVTVTGSVTINNATLTVAGTVTVQGTIAISTIAGNIVPGTAKGDLGKAEDAASSSGDTLVGIAPIRRDTPVAGANVSTDGDYTNMITSNYGAAWTQCMFATKADTYTTTANGTTIDVSARPMIAYSIEVKGTGAAATTWDVRLEASLDNTNFSQVIAHTNADGDGVTKFFTGAPGLYFRSRCAGLVLGGATNIVTTILGMSQ